MMNKYFILIILFLSGCGLLPLDLYDLQYKLIEDKQYIGYRISSKKLEYDVVILGNCARNDRKYTFSFYDKRYKKEASNPQWLFFFNGEQGVYNKYKYEGFSDDEYLNKIEDFAIAMVRSPHVKYVLTSDKLKLLPDLCRKKYSKIIKEKEDRARAEQEKYKKRNELIKKETGLNPMFHGKNTESFDSFISILKNDNLERYYNKFAWFSDGSFRVLQVLGGRVILASLYPEANYPTVTILTNRKLIEGQFWSSASTAPLKFVRLDNYQTVMGTRKQTLVFKEIRINRKKQQ